MPDKIEGYLQVGTNDKGEIVINLPEDRTGHIVFSPNQALHLADSLTRQADRIVALRETAVSQNAAIVTAEQPFEPLYAPLKTPYGWFILLGCDLADPDKFQGYNDRTGELRYDGCRCDNFHGPFKSEEEMWRFVVNDLIDLIRECHTEIKGWEDDAHDAQKEIEDSGEEISKYKKWVDDLQSGMYINCVYCGHQYGPRDKTPATMADRLKEHVEQCPQHPMSALKNENTILQRQLTDQTGSIIAMQDAANSLIDALAIPEGRDLHGAWERALVVFGRYCPPYTSSCPEPCPPNEEE